MLAAVGGGGVKASGLITKVVIPALISPLAAFLLAGLGIVVIYRLAGRRSPGTVTRWFRAGQIVSNSALALAHGTNDAQKTMGVITLALVAHGDLSAKHANVPPGWWFFSDGHLARHLRRRLADHPHRR